ncbi:unnamed protein product [Phaeothamnion confervicola]
MSRKMNSITENQEQGLRNVMKALERNASHARINIGTPYERTFKIDAAKARKAFHEAYPAVVRHHPTDFMIELQKTELQHLDPDTFTAITNSIGMKPGTTEFIIQRPMTPATPQNKRYRRSTPANFTRRTSHSPTTSNVNHVLAGSVNTMFDMRIFSPVPIAAPLALSADDATGFYNCPMYPSTPGSRASTTDSIYEGCFGTFYEGGKKGKRPKSLLEEEEDSETEEDSTNNNTDQSAFKTVNFT